MLGVTQGHKKLHHLQIAYEFILAFHSNSGPILYRFRYIERQIMACP